MSLMQPEKLTSDGTRHIQEAGPERDHRRGRRVAATWLLQLTGLPVPAQLVRQVPPLRREVASEAVTGARRRAALRLYTGRTGKPAAGHRARLTTLGICRTAPNSRSKATTGVNLRRSSPRRLLPLCLQGHRSEARRSARPSVAITSPYSRVGSIFCIALQGSIQKWDNLFDYRFGCLFWQ